VDKFEGLQVQIQRAQDNTEHYRHLHANVTGLLERMKGPILSLFQTVRATPATAAAPPATAAAALATAAVQCFMLLLHLLMLLPATATLVYPRWPYLPMPTVFAALAPLYQPCFHCFTFCCFVLFCLIWCA
jgi:hypothetical protein